MQSLRHTGAPLRRGRDDLRVFGECLRKRRVERRRRQVRDLLDLKPPTHRQSIADRSWQQTNLIKGELQLVGALQQLRVGGVLSRNVD